MAARDAWFGQTDLAASLGESLPGGSSFCQPMSVEDYVSGGETHHDQYYDGLIFVNPPTEHHVRVTKRLTRILDDSCPPGHEAAPDWGWQPAPSVIFRPDILVYALDSRRSRHLQVPPLLVVEVTSRSTRAQDWGRKREAYAQGGASGYWIVDLEAEHLLTMRNTGGQYEVAGSFREKGTRRIEHPFAVTIDLDELFA